jgi:hypothetical protein
MLAEGRRILIAEAITGNGSLLGKAGKVWSLGLWAFR